MRPIVQFLLSKLSGTDVRMWVASVAVVLVLLIVGGAVKLYDRSRKRFDETVALQARVSDALMGEPSLTGLSLTPTVRMPLWRREPVMIELRGSVPRPGLRQAAVSLVLREVEALGKSCCLQDRIVVAPAGLTGAV